MQNETVEVKILEEKPDGVLVKLPFLDIPVEMNHYFLQKRLEMGYFKIQQERSDVQVQG